MFASLLLHIFTIWFYQSISSVSFSQCYILMLNNYSTARFLRANDTCNNSLTSTIAMLITLYPTINHWISNWIVIIVYRCINSSYLFNNLFERYVLKYWYLKFVSNWGGKVTGTVPFHLLPNLAYKVSQPVAWMLMKTWDSRVFCVSFPCPPNSPSDVKDPSHMGCITEEEH